MIINTFKNVGLSLNPNGSENDQIKVKDLPRLIIKNYNLTATVDLTTKEAVTALINTKVAESDNTIVVKSSESTYITAKKAVTGVVNITNRKAPPASDSEIKKWS